MSNKVGNYFAKEGFETRDVVSLFMENRYIHMSAIYQQKLISLIMRRYFSIRPEYVCVWLGLSKVLYPYNCKLICWYIHIFLTLKNVVGRSDSIDKL